MDAYVTRPRCGRADDAAGDVTPDLLLLGMAHLWVYGGGLPMNACPPPGYVMQGIYRFLPHPIYTGFCMICAGTSIRSTRQAWARGRLPGISQL